MSDKVITTIDAAGNATVMLNRPDVHNAFDPEMTLALTATLKKFDASTKVRAVVLMGAGPSFCAGADIGHMKNSAHYTKAQNFKAAQESAEMFYTLYNMRKPTIARVHGAVRGGGLGLVAACDIAIAARTATFRLSEVKIGIIPSMISPYVIAAIGQRQARRYMISGEEFDAAEARRIGMVHAVCEEAELEQTVSAMLTQLYSSGPKAIAACKQLFALSAHAVINRRITDETSRRIAAIRATPEGQEGLSAFLEKRRPDWLEPAIGAAKKKPRKSTAKHS